MSNQREVIASTGNVIPSATAKNIPADHLTELDASQSEMVKPQTEERAERKARLARVLERSPVQDALKVDLPADKHGEWVRNQPTEIHRMQTLGFTVDREYASKSGLHGGGGDEAVIGDVIFMTCDKDTKEIIDEIRHDRFLKVNGKRREEEELKRAVRTSTDGEIPVIVEGSERAATRSDIAAALSQIDSQTN